MTIKNLKRNGGFTLLETIIYIGLFGIIMSGALVGAYNLLEGGNRNIDSTRIQEEGTFLNRKINWALSGATAVTVTGGTKITITRPDLGAQSPLVIQQSGNMMTISRGVGPAIDLNSSRFQISNVIFTYTPAASGRPPSTRIDFQVQGKKFSFRNYIRQ